MFTSTGAPPTDGAAGLTDFARQLAQLFTAKQLDAAIDLAARRAEGTVAWFVAAPVERPGPGRAAAIEFVVEFFVPPRNLDRLEAELSAALIRISPEYARLRNDARIGPPEIFSVPAGTFHQWRIAYRQSEEALRAARWLPEPNLLESVLHQSQVGWREVLA